MSSIKLEFDELDISNYSDQYSLYPTDYHHHVSSLIEQSYHTAKQISNSTTAATTATSITKFGSGSFYTAERIMSSLDSEVKVEEGLVDGIEHQEGGEERTNFKRVKLGVEKTINDLISNSNGSFQTSKDDLNFYKFNLDKIEPVVEIKTEPSTEVKIEPTIEVKIEPSNHNELNVGLNELEKEVISIFHSFELDLNELEKGGCKLLKDGELDDKPLKRLKKRARTNVISLDELFLKKDWCIDDFKIIKPLGRGRFGTVYMVKERSSDHQFALKILDKFEIKENNSIKQVKRELSIQKELNHPNVLKMYTSFQDECNVYLVLEYADRGELYSMITDRGKFSEKDACKLILQIASAIKYLHGKKVIHRDLKPENILIGMDGKVKVGDFGWSVFSKPNKKRLTMCGTLDYLAPEMIEAKPHSNKIDMWSLGILTFEFLTGKPPFEMEGDNNSHLACKRICKLDYQFPPNISDLAKSFIGDLLKLNPKHRLKLEDIPNHPWILKYTK